MNSIQHKLLRLALILLRITRLHRLLCPFFMGDGVILVLHRVLPDKSHPRISANARIEITPQFLEQLLNFFQGLGYEIVSLDTVHQRLSGEMQSDAPFVCFTFDDGYADAREVIYPIFKKYHAPFAVYVVTDFPDEQQLLWWYMLEDLVLEHDIVRFYWQEKEYVFATSSHADKESAYGIIRELILSQSGNGLAEIIDAIFSPYHIHREEYQNQQMSWQQVAELAADPMVTIGGHTVHHSNLKQLTPDQVRAEIQEGKERLQEKTGYPVDHFAYPFGSRDEVGAREFSIARECGFKTMTTVREGTIYPEHRHHLECLPRVEITGRHQDLTLVDLRRCGLIAFLRNSFRRMVTE